jgi:hypothetical protein
VWKLRLGGVFPSCRASFVKGSRVWPSHVPAESSALRSIAPEPSSICPRFQCLRENSSLKFTPSDSAHQTCPIGTKTRESVPSNILHDLICAIHATCPNHHSIFVPLTPKPLKRSSSSTVASPRITHRTSSQSTSPITIS